MIATTATGGRGRFPGRSLPPLEDAVEAAVIAALQVGVAFLASTHQHHREPATIGLVLLLIGPLALAVQRRIPVAVLSLTFAVALVYSALDYYPRGVVFPALVAGYWATARAEQRRPAWASIVLGYLVFVVLLPLTGAQARPSVAWASGIAAWMLLLAVAAEYARARRQRVREAAEFEAAEQRLQLAREVHDLLGHNLALINIQAGVALHLAGRRPQQTETALTAIKQASKEALTELRSVLDLLRRPDNSPPRVPLARLDQLHELLARARDAGLDIEDDLDLPRYELPAGTELAAYRIVQEALTNIARHAPGARSRVRLQVTDDELIVQIDNQATLTPSTQPRRRGNGINGMRERARSVGGRLEAAPRAEGGFRVAARLPLHRR